MIKNFLLKFKESFFSVLPVSVLITVAALCVKDIDNNTAALFAVSSLLLIAGMGVFTLGADMAMMPMGDSLGAGMSGSRKKYLMLLIAFVLGFVITLAEPDLQILAEQLKQGEGKNVFILVAVATGVGVFLTLALLRIYFKLKLKYLLLAFYTVVFIAAAFVPEDFVTIAFDSGGVTTGPITVPFIMAFGMGIAGVRGGETNRNDSFGMLALCSVGPVLAVILLGLSGKSDVGISQTTVPAVNSFADIVVALAKGTPSVLKEVAIALLPIIAVFVLFQVISLRLPWKQIVKIGVGTVYTYVGLTVFLTAVNVGFLPMGKLLGAALAEAGGGYALIPFGIVMGSLIILAEPAVHILTRQVEQLTGGAVSKKVMLAVLSAAVAASVGLSMLRVVTGISIWYFILPCYAISVLLAFFVPEIFTAMAFDSGGVASGAITSTFLLPFAIGACTQLGGNVFEDAYGLVAFVAMTPLLTVQIMGLVFTVKSRARSGTKKKLTADGYVASVADTEDLPVVFFDGERENAVADNLEKAESVAGEEKGGNTDE